MRDAQSQYGSELKLDSDRFVCSISSLHWQRLIIAAREKDEAAMATCVQVIFEVEYVSESVYFWQLLYVTWKTFIILYYLKEQSLSCYFKGRSLSLSFVLVIAHGHIGKKLKLPSWLAYLASHSFSTEYFLRCFFFFYLYVPGTVIFFPDSDLWFVFLIY